MFAFALFLAVIGGFWISSWLAPRERLIDRAALGVAGGCALWSLLGFAIASCAGLTTGVAVFSAALVLLLGHIARRRAHSESASARERLTPSVLLLTLLTAGLVLSLASGTLIETPRGLAIGDNHNYGDLPFHMAIAAGFAYGDNFPPNHPELAGVPLTYPFLGDFLSAMLLVLGASWRNAFFWPTLLLGLAIVPTLVRFGEVVTGSRAMGRVAAALTFFSGGLGFLDLFRAGSLTSWTNGSLELTIRESGLRYANFIVTLFIPQRSILFGWSLLFGGLSLLVAAMQGEGDERTRSTQALRAGALLGLLPLVHSHSFAVAIGVLVCACFWDASRPFARQALVGLLPLALPAVIFMASRNSLDTARFFGWNPGFDHGDTAIAPFWIRNAGLFLPLAIAGIVRPLLNKDRRAFLGLPFAALFLIANLFQLSPWIWDNIKFLAPAHAGMAPFAALALTALWQRRGLMRGAAIGLFVVATLSGAADVFRLATKRVQYDLFSHADIDFAREVALRTPPQTIILAAPAHDHPVLLSGRPLYLGYEGHLWSQGLRPGNRPRETQAFFQDPATARLPVAVGAIALTSRETRMYGTDPSRMTNMTEIVQTPWRLFKVETRQ